MPGARVFGRCIVGGVGGVERYVGGIAFQRIAVSGGHEDGGPLFLPATSVPVQYAPSSSLTSAPTLGCLVPSSVPKVMPSATPLANKTVKSIMAAAHSTDSLLFNNTSLLLLA